MPTYPGTISAILWPLIGAGLLLAASALLLAVGSFIPSWLRRIVAAAAAIAGLLAITGSAEQGSPVVTAWQPLNLFRTSPAFQFDDLSATVATLVSGVTAAMLLGIRGRSPTRTSWHGLTLVTLAGVVAVAAADNLLALLLGSALIDLALIGSFLFAAGDESESGTRSLAIVLPGLASTLLLFFAAVRVDAQVGHVSLQALNVPESTLVLVAAAGALRLMVFPFHPRRIARPEDAALLLLPTAAGIYLIGRVQQIAPVISGGWLAVAAAGALLVGGLKLWTGMLALPAGSRQAPDDRQPVIGETWPAALIHRAGYAILYAAFIPSAAPWPLLGILLPLALLAVCWDSLLEEPAPPRARWLGWVEERVGPWWQTAQSRVATRWPALERWRARQPSRYVPPVVLILALGALLGLPATVGMRDRWPIYAALLRHQSPWLVAVLAADTWLAAGVWRVVRSRPVWLRRDRPPAPLALLAAVALGLGIVLGGLAPSALGFSAAGSGGVSGWGLGFFLILPWLLGAWLSGLDGQLARYAGLVSDLMTFDWLYTGAGWLANLLRAPIYWLGQVAEGEGWWGWALIVLALAAVLLTVR